jgi:predicted amidohydrolase YtcJ
VSRDRAHLATQPDFDPSAHWLYGMGWDQTTLGLTAFPSAADLDASAVLAAVPIALLRVDVHAVWLNGAALARLGSIPAEVPGGEVVRDAHGTPTGILLDDAMDLVLAVAALPSPAKVRAYSGRVGRI